MTAEVVSIADKVKEREKKKDGERGYEGRTEQGEERNGTSGERL